MAGHSQFANIKHRKEAQDGKKAKIFTRVLREIFVAVKSGGEDQEMNPRLRLALDNAKSVNLPKDKVDGAIKRASGVDVAESYDEIRYDGYGPGGVGIIVEALTNNKNRTAPEVRSVFSKFGGNLGETGSLDFVFSKFGVIYFDKTLVPAFDDLFEFAIENNATDVLSGDQYYEILTDFKSFYQIKDALEKKFTTPTKAIIEYRKTIDTPSTLNKSQEETLEKLIDALEDLDDVQSVWF